MKQATAILLIVLAGSARAAVLEGPIINPSNGNEYYLISTPSWTAAELEAVALGGHLVTIRSAEENAWVFDTFIAGRAFNPWIGLNDAAVEGTFVWSSGQAVIYTNWKPGEPNNLGGEDYARFDFGPGWNDVPNTSGNTEHGIVEIVTPSPDTDGDGTVDDFDNCPDDFNPEQEDTDGDGVGDLCNDGIDADADEYADDLDNCPDDFNPDQADADGDRIGDLCDEFPDDPDNDLAECEADLDQALIELQECRENPLFPDEDGDGEADPTDACPGTPADLEVDGDGCSLEQFCSGFDVSSGGGRASCNNADWRNNEPVGSGRDCITSRTACLPTADACGLGFELALLLPGLMWLRQRRRIAQP